MAEDIDELIDGPSEPEPPRKVPRKAPTTIKVRWTSGYRGKAAGKARYRDDIFDCTPAEAAKLADKLVAL